MENKEREEEVIRLPTELWIIREECQKINEYTGREKVFKGIDAQIQEELEAGNIKTFGDNRCDGKLIKTWADEIPKYKW